MTRDEAERLLGLLESLMYYRDEMTQHSRDVPRMRKLMPEYNEAREEAIELLRGV